MSRQHIAEHFPGPVLDDGLWVDHYLPQWTTADRSAARYDFDAAGLRLRIDADQPAWLPADGPMRVSNIQTGTYSGARGSKVGTHRHRLDLEVATEQPVSKLWTASGGTVTVKASASADPSCMVGIWLVGFEQSGPADSGELCLAELFGHTISPTNSTVRVGVKAHHDPRLVTDVSDVDLPIDTSGPHDYSVRWGAEGAEFAVDDTVIKVCRQHLNYDLQLMIDLFEFPPAEASDPAAYPKVAHIHQVILNTR